MVTGPLLKLIMAQHTQPQQQQQHCWQQADKPEPAEPPLLQQLQSHMQQGGCGPLEATAAEPAAGSTGDMEARAPTVVLHMNAEAGSTACQAIHPGCGTSSSTSDSIEIQGLSGQQQQRQPQQQRWVPHDGAAQHDGVATGGDGCMSQAVQAASCDPLKAEQPAKLIVQTTTAQLPQHSEFNWYTSQQRHLLQQWTCLEQQRQQKQQQRGWSSSGGYMGGSSSSSRV